MEFKKFIKLPKDQWPVFKIRWDLDLEKCLLLFGMKKSEIDNGSSSILFPKGFLIGWVNLDKLSDNVITSLKKYKKNDIWNNDLNEEKIAKIIYHCVNGEPISPLFMDTCNIGSHVRFNVRDGHHRLVVCFAKKINKIPIFISRDKKEAFDELLKGIEWIL